MDTTPYIDAIKQQLLDAGGGGERSRALAERLAGGLDAAAHVAIVNALSSAAEELNSAGLADKIAVTVDGREARLVPAVDAAHTDASHHDSDVGAATVTLPSEVRQAALRAAALAGMSLDAWVVSMVRDALEPGPRSRRGLAAAAYQGWWPERP